MMSQVPIPFQPEKLVEYPMPYRIAIPGLIHSLRSGQAQESREGAIEDN